MKFSIPLCLLLMTSFGGTADANQEAKLRTSTLIEKCGGYKVLFESVEKDEESKEKFPRTLAIVAERLDQYAGGVVVNITGSQKAELEFPNSKAWGIHSSSALNLVMTTKGEFGIYEVVGRGEAGKHDGSDTIRSFPDFVKDDVHWYVSKEPLMQKKYIRDATSSQNDQDNSALDGTIDIHFVESNNGSVQKFAEHVRATVGTPMLAALDGRALTSIMLTDMDPQKPFKFKPGFVPTYVRAFSSVIAHRVLPIEVKLKELSRSRPEGGVVDCPVTY
ncbi:hypothetical protein LCGC14_0112910 [marine sediment metagenome]|uniref:Uncharacterized protein n=2 Tax=root TaxID=1 RepID=A0A7V1BDX0_9RHOB|nr:hypothetical protein [Sulfitobacter litoralis]HDZ51441.1 hypothetical protein [Sulfitobacter litoralis]